MEKAKDPKTSEQEPPKEEYAEEPEQNPELTAFFEKYPKEEDALALPLEEKKSFILKYYSEDVNSDEMLEKMLDEAEQVLEKELKDGKGKKPFSENLVLSMLAISKARVVDELLEEVEKMYIERRKFVKGKEIKDQGVIHFTQLNCSKLAFNLQNKILKQAEEEAKSRDLPPEIMDICVMIARNDMQSFVEIERLYNFRKTEENKEKEFDLAKVKQYIKESLGISEKILSGELDSTVVFLFPHLLSDKLYNLTGFESEEVVYYIRKMVQNDSIDEELANLIVKEAYSVEKSKKSCQKNFDIQMAQYEQNMIEAYARRAKEMEDSVKDPLDDPAIKKMIQTGMMGKSDVEDLLRKRGALPGARIPQNVKPPTEKPSETKTEEAKPEAAEEKKTKEETKEPAKEDSKPAEENK